MSDFAPVAAQITGITPSEVTIVATIAARYNTALSAIDTTFPRAWHPWRSVAFALMLGRFVGHQARIAHGDVRELTEVVMRSYALGVDAAANDDLPTIN